MGFDFFGYCAFGNDLPPVTGINELTLSEAVYDEVYVRENTDSNVDLSTTKDIWLPDTRLDAKFEGNLEAGNVNNQGVTITSFIIKRRMSTDSTFNNLQIGTVPFVNNAQMDFTDMTQPVGSLVYQVVPFGSNNMQGVPNEVTATSGFVGWWIVDKDKMTGYQFTMVPVNDPHNMVVYGSVQTKLNQGRIQIDTMSKYPQVYYTDSQFAQFDLSALMNPTNGYSYQDYQNILSMITQHKNLVVKGGSGDIYVCDVFNPQRTSLMNAYQGVDYYALTVSCMEIADYTDFMMGYSS